jgi:hypothetical protein
VQDFQANAVGSSARIHVRRSRSLCFIVLLSVTGTLGGAAWLLNVV